MNKILTTIGSTFVLTTSVQAAQVFTTDVIVQGSTCTGFDCSSSESFGFDTLRLKENNLRLHFDDTSSSASFPKNDWRITANDSGNGGSNYLAIEDATAGRQVFRVDAGAPANALRVDSAGDVGIGTATPVVELHAVDGNTPALRLEQDGSSGFTPQTWDIAGNETNFFIRDVTNSSKLPFKIKPGAPDNSLFIAADGDIGLGTQSPAWALHVRRSGTVISQNESSNNGAVQMRMKTDSSNRRLVAVNSSDTVKSQIELGDGQVMLAGNSDSEGSLYGLFGSNYSQMRLKASSENRRLVALDSGNTVKSQILLGNGEIKLAGASDSSNLYATFNASGLVVNGTVTPDYVFKNDYKLMPLSELKAFVLENHHLPEVASETEIANKGLNMTEMQMSLLKKVEELTLYTLAQQDTIEELKQKLVKLEKN